MHNSIEQRQFARNLRSNMTDAERCLWKLLKCRQLAGHKFRRQAAIGVYIVDFVCLARKFIIELDGVSTMSRPRRITTYSAPLG
jgi:very-short-patch-repair endonuclease